jgi:hypothetical protein
VIRRSFACFAALIGLGCAGFDEGPPARADGARDILVVTTELEPSVREELGAALEDRLEAGRYAVAVALDGDEVHVLVGCTVPLAYEWMVPLGLSEHHDSDEALFVGAPKGRSEELVRLDRDTSAEFRTSRWATLPDELLPEPWDIGACASATHVVREFMFGTTDSDDAEALVGFWLEPLPDPGQRKWAARKSRREMAGMAAMGVLGTVAAASLGFGLAVLCLADLDNCESDEGDDYAAEVDEQSERGSLLGRGRLDHRIDPALSPDRGVELGRTRRVQVETGGGGFVLRF